MKLNYTSVITLCLTTYLLLVSHTHNGDDTLPRLIQLVSTYNSHLQAKLRTVIAYRVVVRIWDSIWLTAFLYTM